MTGLPALLCNIERLPETARGHVVIEITSETDKPSVHIPAGMQVQWLINPHPGEGPSQLADAVRATSWEDGTPAVWAACEFDTMRDLRTYFRTERGRAGRTEDQHKVEKRADAQAQPA